MKRPTPTLQLVADAAGVHRSTASRALNPDTAHLLSTAVAKRIQAASAALGYRRDLLAASLRTRRSGLVGIMVPDLANPVFGPVLAGIEAVLGVSGYTSLIVNSDDDDYLARATENLIARRIEGMVLATARKNDRSLAVCLEAGMPTVMINRAEDEPSVSAVISDDVEGMELAVGHLLSLGHRAIGHIAGPANLSTGVRRRAGFEATMAQAGLTGPIVTAVSFTRAAGLTAAHELMAHQRLTAIAAANDMLALGAYQALADLGLSCPGDMSITGHNDMPMVDMVQPPLTTVRIHPEQIGRDAAELLLAHIRDPAAIVTVRMRPPEFVLRASTSPPTVRPLTAVPAGRAWLLT